MCVNRIYFRWRKTFRCAAVVLVLSPIGCVASEPRTGLIEQDLGPVEHREFRTPDWAKGLVWYQVFPERFRDGNLGNIPAGWDLTPVDWDAPFGEVSIEEIERGWNRGRVAPMQFGFDPDRRGGAQRNLIYSRRYGGDLQGVYEQLESLKAMGVQGIYLCPVFKSRSLHKYDASDHRHIDPTLAHPGENRDPGPGHNRLRPGEDPFDETTWAWTPSDIWFVEEFLPKAKSLGLRVMIDAVWNHVGLDHFAFNDVRENGSDSPFADWFQVVFNEQGELIGWQGWSRVNGSLPEFRHVGADIAEGPKSHMMAVTRRWMDPNGDGDPSDGIDGWRLDVAGEIGADFWRDWRSLVKSINPEALIVAEIWNDANDMLGERAFDAQMNYPFAYPIADWLALGGEGVLGNAQVAARRLERVFHHDLEIDLVQLNLMDSHDTERLASMMMNRRERGYDNDSSRWFPGYESGIVDGDARQRALAAYAAMIACPGGIMIYNGDEYGLPGADDPDNRRPIPWDSITAEQLAFRDRVQQLLRASSSPDISETIRLGDASFASIGKHTLRVTRVLGDQRIDVLIAPSFEMLQDGDGHHDGWVRDRETERKLDLGARNLPYLIRVYRR